MTLVIATGGIDLSVGAMMAIAGATAATMTSAGYPLAYILGAALAVGALCGLWNGFLVAVLQIQLIVATLILMVAGELDAILAVVIGGGSLLGGRFNLLLSVVGALIIQSMNTGILLSGYKPEFNLVLKAVVVLAVLLVQSPSMSLQRLWRRRKS